MTSFVCAETRSAKSFATVSVTVATVAQSAKGAVARLARESERLNAKEERLNAKEGKVREVGWQNFRGGAMK